MTIIDPSGVQKPQSQRFPCGAALPFQKLCRLPNGGRTLNTYSIE
jgi:hypothetical protein